MLSGCVLCPLISVPDGAPPDRGEGRGWGVRKTKRTQEEDGEYCMITYTTITQCMYIDCLIMIQQSGLSVTVHVCTRAGERGW